jgi:hypothetical protein
MSKQIWVKGADGQTVDYEGAVMLMDDEIREDLHTQASDWTEQEFMNAYCAAHLAKYGEEFIVN